MNFGAEFDDEVFEKPRTKTCKSEHVKQGAKVCTPEWFLEETVVNKDGEDLLKCLRYKADFLYFSKNYAEASAIYNQCLKMLPITNLPARRECMENLARSYLHQDCPESALEWALQMHAASVSADQKIVSWNLLAKVCHRLKKYEEELEALHCCLETHKSVPEFWLRLAYCYAGLFKIDLPGSGHCSQTSSGPFCCSFKSRTIILSEPSTSSTSECAALQIPLPQDTETKKNNESSLCNNEYREKELTTDETMPKCEMCSLATQVISACLIRTRLLLSNSEPSQFSLPKSMHMNEKVNLCLTHLEVEQSFIDEASQMLRSEIYNSLQFVKDGAEALSSNAAAKAKESELVLAHKMEAMDI